MPSNRTTRRTVLAGAASIPIAAAMAGAAPASPPAAADQNLFDIEAKVREIASRWPGLNLLTRQAHDRKDHARQNELEGEFDELVGQAAHLCGEASDIRAATMEGVYPRCG